MSCSKIVLLDSYCDLDDFRDHEGALSLTISEETAISINKKNEELTELEKIVSDYSNSFELILSSRETTILNSIQYEKTASEQLKYRAYLLKDGLVLIDGFLYIEAVSERVFDGSLNLKCQLIGTHQQWKTFLRENTLTALQLGQQTWNYNSILDLFQNNDEGFQEGSSAIYPLLSNNGRRLGSQGACTLDIRFNVYLKALIDAAFCAAGYKVRSQFFNSQYFRRQSLYCLQSSFGINEQIAKGTLAEVESSVDSPIGGGDVPLDTIITDNGSKFDTLNFWYVNNTNNRIYDLFIDLNITQENTNAISGSASAIGIRIEDSGGSPILPFPAFYFPPLLDRSGNGTLTALNNSEVYQAETTVDLGQVLRDELVNEGYLEAGWRVYLVHVNSINPTAKVNAGAFAKFYTKNPHWFEVEDVFNISSVLDNVNSIYDYLQDFKKLFNLRFKTIESQKIVEIEPAASEYETYDNFQDSGFTAEGFEGNVNNPNDVIDITEFVDVCQFIERKFPAQQNPIYFDFKFKQSSDEYQKYKLFGEENFELFQNDTSAEFRNVEKKNLELKIIEPVLNDFDRTVSNVPDIAGTYIPFMWQNAQDDDSDELPEVGSNVAPRIMFVYGWQSQIQAPDAIGFEFEGNFFQFVPNIGQIFEIEIVFPNVIDFGIPPQNIVFKDNLSETEQLKNLVNTFYPENINDEINIITLSIKTKISNLFFKCIDVRKLLRIFSEKSSLMRFNGFYKLVSINKNVNSDELTTIVLKPKIPCDG